MTRVKDPALLERLHTVWNEHGCAICGQGPVELHHVKKRSQGGADSIGNILGLCGAYSKGQHHLAVENHTVELVPSSGGWGWKDTRTGEWGYCSLPLEIDPAASVRPRSSGAGAAAPVSNEGAVSAPAVPSPSDPGGVPEISPPGSVTSPLNAGSIPAGKQSTPEQRFEFLRVLTIRTAHAYMAMAENLLAVHEENEWRSLGFDSFKAYVGEEGLGIPSGTVSKMLKVARAYRDEWPRAVATGASVERLYLAARVADDVDEAIGLAETMPTHELVAMAKGEPVDSELCPECHRPLPASYEARKHDRASLERGEARKGTFVSDI